MKYLHFAALLMIFVSFSYSCKKTKKGIVEVKVAHYSDDNYSHSYYAVLDESSSFPEHTVTLVQLDDYFPKSIAESSVAKNYKVYIYYWPDQSAKDLGYTQSNFNENMKNDWYNADGASYPGVNGYWINHPELPGPFAQGSGGPTTSNTGGNTGGGSGICAQPYDSPVNPSIDAQLDAFCAAAYAYRCQDGKPLSDPSVQYSCQTYDQMKEPGTPACPYCQ